MNNMIAKVENEVKKLYNCGDTVGIQLTHNFGFVIEVEEYEDGSEYFIEPNTIDEDGCFEPIGDNCGVPFGDFTELRIVISNYLNKLNI